MTKNDDISVSRQIALMVDGDNISKDIIPSVLEETSKYGTIAVRRVYADFQHGPFRFQLLHGVPQLADLPADALPPLGLSVSSVRVLR